jgi:lysyl-tRNA synthetase, class I
MERRKGSELTALERKHFDARVRAARTWLDKFAPEEDKIHLQETLPARAGELSQTQRAFSRKLGEALKTERWEDDALQARIFDAARRTPIGQGEAFKAIYRLLLDRDMGPRAGALMAVLERDFVVRRLTELPLDEAAFVREAAISKKEFDVWREKEKANITETKTEALAGGAVSSVEITLNDGKTYRRLFWATDRSGSL